MGPLRVMEAEHHEFRSLLGELQRFVAAGDTDRQCRIAVALGQLLRAHITKQDHVLFPLAEHLLAASERQEVDALAGAVQVRE
jgi:hemerythrin-like domain-containing protein